MSCPYYWYNDHYACRKTGKDVNEDTYYKYCRNYSYDDCPIYKGNEESGCFLTSACAEAMGLPDDCYELTVLRFFRDGYLSNQPEGKTAICEYYHVAPQIVQAIRKKENCAEIFLGLYRDLVLPCVQLIDAGKNEEAYKHYRKTVDVLKAEFI